MEYTSEELNYFRICYIAFNLVPEGLRKLLKQEWDFLYKTTPGEWKDSPKNGLDFCNKESRKSPSKNTRYLATIQNGNTAEWNCSCLFFAILFSDSIGTTLSAANRKEVDDLRQVRNGIAHISEAKLSDTEFRGYVGRVLRAFNSLSLPINDIEAVKNQTSFPTAEVNNLKAQVANLRLELEEVKANYQVAQDTIQRKEEQVECLTQEINSKVESFCNLTSKPSHKIIRRSNDVTRIMAKMQELDDGSNGVVSTIYLSGNPGCGKSQIARQIGQEFFKIGSGEIESLKFVATLNAETLETLADSYISLAKQLGITEYSLTNLATTKVNNSRERIQHLQCLILPKIKQFFKWLMIADNVVDLSSVCKHLPQTASEEWGRGQVLITTQDSTAIPTNAPHTYHESLSKGMQPEDAVELLKQVSQISNHDQAEKVAEVLEYQPLALAAAAFHVQRVVNIGNPNYCFSSYLEELWHGDRKENEEDFLENNASYDQHQRELPFYVLARGHKALAAYQRALKEGKTLDKRVKILFIGQDRAGKTSVAKSLKGEQFNEHESSTDGVQMHKPLKDVGAQPWRNSTTKQNTTAYHHKCAVFISDELSAESQQEIRQEQTGLLVHSESRKTMEENRKTKVAAANPKNGSELEWGSKSYEINRTVEEAPRQEKLPDEIARIVEENIKDRSANCDGIWPIIWDFAGQAVYRAIHPIFMSPEAIYVLVFDLTMELSVTAQCRVKDIGQDERVVPAPDSYDTNLDHIMRWMDLVHSLMNSQDDQTRPPVILVGTHADRVKGDPAEQMEVVADFFWGKAKVFGDHIVRTFAVDNTLAGKEHDQEDPQIVRLRREILKVANNIPNTKKDVPLKWLQVENEVYDQASMGLKYLTRQNFKTTIADKICHFVEEDDFEELLHFLHDRGTIVYHDRADNPDGLVVLDPQWLIDVLCEIITVKRDEKEQFNIGILRGDLQHKGILANELLDHTCKILKLDHIKESLLYIMKKFNLLCEYKNEVGKPVYLVPCMLTTKPEQEHPISTNETPAPVYITFNSQYVPCGLFSRLLVLFLEWVTGRTRCKQPELFANSARFLVGEYTFVDFLCHKSVIKVHIWARDKSNPVEKEPDVCSELLRHLKESLEKLFKECHWLCAVSWDFSGRCNLCPGLSDAKGCYWHKKQGCCHDDCAHYVSSTIRSSYCERAKDQNVTPLQTWSQALEEKTSQEQHVSETVPRRLNSGRLRVTLVADEWKSSKGGLSTLNRELATQLAKYCHPDVQVTILVPQRSEDDDKAAKEQNVNLVQATMLAGSDPIQRLCFPPDELVIDVVIGHGCKLGPPAQLIAKQRKCKWVHVVHTASEELAMFKKRKNAIPEGSKKHQTEVQLSEQADLIAAVGPKLTEAFDAYLCLPKKEVFDLTPGIIEEFSSLFHADREPSKFRVLVFGRGDVEDFDLKGYDIAAKAVAMLNDTTYRLIFVGAPKGEENNVKESLLKHGISGMQLIVRGFCESRDQLKKMFLEADLAIMPSRTEGFGLTALEALSAGLPILVSGNSGFAEALKEVQFGSYCIVESEEADVWSKKIKDVRWKRRKIRLEEARDIQQHYASKYSWEHLCKRFVRKMENLVIQNQ